jgi:hypothetical protein
MAIKRRIVAPDTISRIGSCLFGGDILSVAGLDKSESKLVTSQTI